MINDSIIKNTGLMGEMLPFIDNSENFKERKDKMSKILKSCSKNEIFSKKYLFNRTRRSRQKQCNTSLMNEVLHSSPFSILSTQYELTANRFIRC